MEKEIIIILIIINVITFFTYGIDKWKAQHDKWRTSEFTLLMLAILGGSIGAYAGIKVWHHKTLHLKFKYGVPAIFLIEVALLIYFAYIR